MKHFFFTLLPGALVAFVLFFFGASYAHAATFYLSLNKTVAQVGDSVVATMRIDSEGAEFNAAQTTFRFPKDILQVERIDYSKSLFSFWLVSPSFSNENGTVDFIGGSSDGFSGRSLSVADVYFRVKGTGVADLSFNDSAITSSDGSGTNILTSVQGAKVTVPVTASEAVSLAAPAQISRPVVPAVKLPPAPVVRVPLYLNNGRWNNLVSPFYVEWDLPSDVTGVAAVVNKDPVFSPTNNEGLFVSKRFEAIDDGIYFAHVRFRNNLGWGPVGHYRISLDTVPPVPFEISFLDYPSPTEPHRVNYATGDALSGVDRFELSVDRGDPVVSTSTKGGHFSLMRHLPPGEHVIEVRAFDKAGNSTVAGIHVSVAAIESPTVTLAAEHVFANEVGPVLTGTSVPNAALSLVLKQDSDGVIVYEESVSADFVGRWNALFPQPLKIGDYFVEVVATNARGEMSYPVRSETFSVRERPILILWGVSLTAAGFWAILALIISGVFVGGVYFNYLLRAQMGNRALIAQRDIITFSNLIEKDIRKLRKFDYSKLKPDEAAEVQFILNDLEKNMEKIGKYIVKNIGEIPR